MFKIANVGARQATLSDIACQPTLALVAETKLLVYNVNYELQEQPYLICGENLKICGEI